MIISKSIEIYLLIYCVLYLYLILISTTTAILSAAPDIYIVTAADIVARRIRKVAADITAQATIVILTKGLSCCKI